MQLSILLPTHRCGLLAASRIAQACSWAGPEVEVIVRDNSGDAKKRELLSYYQRDNCRIVLAEPCGPLENFREVLRLAKGEFIYTLADDDFCFDRAISSLPALIAEYGADPRVVGIAGAYAVETSKGTSIANYQNLDSDDAAARVAGYLAYPGPNVLFYSPLRREVACRLFDFLSTMPAHLSFHDQIFCLFYLLSGKFVRLSRLLYLYDMGVWETAESAQKRDVDFYVEAGLDPAINKLHWFLCGFEGAALSLNSDAFPDHPRAQRQAIADRWFATMFARFKGNPRLTCRSPWTEDANRLCAKLLASTGQLSFQEMLTEISTFIALLSTARAQRYYDFWDAVINKGRPTLRKTGS